MCSRRLSKPKNESTPLLDADREKSAIQSHPLFPLLEHLFFKCEYSTSNLNSSNTKVDVDEMLAMIADKGPETNGDQSPGGLGSGPSWRTRDEELDQLMLRAIQVLRIQLLELEKVDELCKDFCARYITCLKGKVTQEMLLGWSDLGDEESCSPPSSSPMFGDGDPNGDPVNKAPPAIVATMQTPNGQVSIPLLIPFLITPSLTSSPASAFSTPTPRTGIEAASLEKTVVNGSSKGPINIRTPSSTVITHSTLGAATSSILADSADSLYGGDKPQRSADPGPSTNANAGKGKRGSLPRKAVDILRGWLFQNIRHPYPSEEEKRDLCAQSGLNLLQVNNWFINARRRILQPLLDGAASNVLAPNPASSHLPKSTSTPQKKRSPTAPKQQPASRYWPESLVPNGDRRSMTPDPDASGDGSSETEQEKPKKQRSMNQALQKNENTS